MRLSILCADVSEALPSKLLRLSGAASPSVWLGRRNPVMPRGNERMFPSASIADGLPISAGPDGVLAKFMIVPPDIIVREGPHKNVTT